MSYSPEHACHCLLDEFEDQGGCIVWSPVGSDGTGYALLRLVSNVVRLNTNRDQDWEQLEAGLSRAVEILSDEH